MGLTQSIETAKINAKHKDSPHLTLLDHSSVATLRAVTDATQDAISAGPTTWADVEKLLMTFGTVDILVREAFPGSRVVSDLAERVNKTLMAKGFTAENTLFAASVCPDEINHVYNNLSQMFTRTWGECFQMGGLAGIPFSGQTGFGAFSAHIPDDGHLFILFAPHIGISPSGDFGLYAREGQSKDCGAACGASVAAFHHVSNGGLVPDFTQLGKFPFDYQQQWIISKIAEKMDIINAAEDKMVELSKQMYAIIENYMLNIVSTENVPGGIVLLGGVHINTPTEMEDFFWPIKFKIRRHGQEPEDLLYELRSDLKEKESTPGGIPGNVTRFLVRNLSIKQDMGGVESTLSPTARAKSQRCFNMVDEDDEEAPSP